MADLKNEEGRLWAKRDTLEDCLALIDLYQRILALEPRNEEYWVKLTYAYYLAGYGLEKERKKRLDLLHKCVLSARKAVEINPESIGGHYWIVSCHGNITLIKGVLAGGFKIGETIKGLNLVASKDPRYHLGGVFRYWGRFIWALPWVVRKVVDIDLEDSLYFLNKALEVEPHYFETHTFLAETYLKMGRRSDARSELEWIMRFSPDDAPEIGPENRIMRRWAEDLYRKEFVEGEKDEYGLH